MDLDPHSTTLIFSYFSYLILQVSVDLLQQASLRLEGVFCDLQCKYRYCICTLPVFKDLYPVPDYMMI